MMEHSGPKAARARRQERVAKVVWGSLFLVMGVLFTLHDMGRIDLSEPVYEYATEHAVDGDPETRWSSEFEDRQWLTVDLGSVSPLRRIRLNWEAAYAKDYELQVSSDGVEWRTVANVLDGDGGTDDHEVDATGRYVRVACTRRATPYGYSLWEIEVFDPEGVLLSRGKHATASSVENVGPYAHWLRFWPLLLVASGLPLLLAPRDDANQVFGLILTSVGAYLQLQRLHLVPWGFRQVSSLLLVVVGLIILIQSQRRADTQETGGPGSPEDRR